MSTVSPATREVLGKDLQVGDRILFCNGLHEITAISDAPVIGRSETGWIARTIALRGFTLPPVAVLEHWTVEIAA